MAEYLVAEANLVEDRNAIIAIWEKNLPSVLPPNDKYDWYYLNNPCGKGRCLLVCDAANHHPVGVAGFGRRRFKVRGNMVEAGINSDLAVAKEHRSLLPAMMLQKGLILSVPNEVTFIYGAPNKQAVGVVLRAGFKKVGETACYVKVLRLERYILRFIQNPTIAKWMGRVMDPLFRFFSSEHRSHLPDDWNAQTFEEFDLRFDALWNEVSHRYPIIGERRAHFLTWRYAIGLAAGYVTFGLVHQGENKLLGYIIYYIEKDSVVIADMLAVHSDDVVDALLSQFIRFVRHKEQHAGRISVGFMGPHWLHQKLTQFGFSLREAKQSIVVFVDPNDPLAATLCDPANWYFFPHDEDYNDSGAYAS